MVEQLIGPAILAVLFSGWGFGLWRWAQMDEWRHRAKDAEEDLAFCRAVWAKGSMVYVGKIFGWKQTLCCPVSEWHNNGPKPVTPVPDVFLNAFKVPEP